MKTNKDTALPRFLGIDYGERNIGLALGYNGLVMPLRTVSNKTERDALFEINKVIVENKVGNIVIGIPLTADKGNHRRPDCLGQARPLVNYLL